jgi:signal transduction histidine kinase
LVYQKNRFSRTNVVLSCFCLSLCGWLFGYYMMYNATNSQSALFWARVGFTSVAFIPTLAFHFIVSFLGMRFAVLLSVAYAIIPLAIFLGWTGLIYERIGTYFWGYYPVAGKLLCVFIMLFAISFCAGLIMLWNAVRAARNTGRDFLVQQYLYVFYAFLVGTTGIIDFIIKYQLSIYPFGYLSALGFISIIAYAIVRYRLLDIDVVITRVTIFVTVYTIVLGLPIWVGFQMFGMGPWLWPIALMAALATAGPFIFIYMQRRAEDRLLAEQRRYQAALRQASAGMGRIRDLGKLLNLIVFLLTRSVRMEHAFVYLRQPDSNDFLLSAARRIRPGSGELVSSISAGSILLARLDAQPNILVTDELQQRAQDGRDPGSTALVRALEALRAALAVPVMVRNQLTAVIVMGPRKEGRLYNTDDLAVFTILANQVALAIENARYLENLQAVQQRLIESEKMAAIGFLAGGLSHQLKNRFTSLLFFTDFAARSVESSRGVVMPSGECEETLSHLQKITQGIESSKQVLNGILDYAADRETKVAVNLKTLVSTSLEFISFKISPGSIEFAVEIADDVPPVRGNFAQLQEVMFNLIDNACHAMMEKKSAGGGLVVGRESGREGEDEVSSTLSPSPTHVSQPTPHPQAQQYKPAMHFTAAREGDMVVLTVEDNGTGIRPEDMRRLFTPLFSTKQAQKQGHGLGLYVMKQIIEANHKGKIAYFSEYGAGVRVEIRLPIV